MTAYRDEGVTMERKYRALRTIATIFKILGWVILILGILSACATSAAMLLGGAAMMGFTETGGGGDAGALWGAIMAVVTFILMVITVGLYALILIAASEGIQVVLDIEENTREMARRLGERGVAGPPPAPSR
jgi:ABC-type multidrug transport system fused ATPase/permease subunit